MIFISPSLFTSLSNFLRIFAHVFYLPRSLIWSPYHTITIVLCRSSNGYCLYYQLFNFLLSLWATNWFQFNSFQDLWKVSGVLSSANDCIQINLVRIPSPVLYPRFHTQTLGYIVFLVMMMMMWVSSLSQVRRLYTTLQRLLGDYLFGVSGKYLPMFRWSDKILLRLRLSFSHTLFQFIFQF